MRIISLAIYLPRNFCKSSIVTFYFIIFLQQINDRPRHPSPCRSCYDHASRLWQLGALYGRFRTDINKSPPSILILMFLFFIFPFYRSLPSPSISSHSSPTPTSHPAMMIFATTTTLITNITCTNNINSSSSSNNNNKHSFLQQQQLVSKLHAPFPLYLHCADPFPLYQEAMRRLVLLLDDENEIAQT